MPIIAINAQLLSGQAGYRQAGIHTYIKQLLNHLPPDEQLQYKTFTQQGASHLLPPILNGRESNFPTHKPIVRIAWEQTAFPLLTAQKQADVLHSMAFVTPLLTRKPTVVTVYDLSPFHYPDRLPRFKRWYLQTQIRRS
ncbi:MAG TPA: glycosyltransferase family 1 protein, partial [Anaerolineae bacterium]|nr:glycosyltransferase family 1 protein [Anaerolineae bacterium]